MQRYLIWRKNELQLLQKIIVTDTYHKKNLGPPVSIGGPHYTKYNKLVTRISLTETVIASVQYFRTEQQLKIK
jgi:hypothetical protein